MERERRPTERLGPAGATAQIDYSSPTAQKSIHSGAPRSGMGSCLGAQRPIELGLLHGRSGIHFKPRAPAPRSDAPQSCAASLCSRRRKRTHCRAGSRIAQARAACHLWRRRERPGDHGVQTRGLRAAPPRVTEALVQIDLQHLAADDPVPPRRRLRLESEAVPDEKLHVIDHEPRREQLGLGQRSPYFRGRVWQVVLHGDRLRFGFGVPNVPAAGGS